MAWNPVNLDRLVAEAAWTVQDRYRFSWCDALIVAAAQKANCRFLLSEGFRHEQDLDGITVINPFIVAPDKVLAEGPR